MATSLAEIESFLKNENLKYTPHEDYIRISFITDDYQDADGDKSLFLVIKPEETGEYVKIIAPILYSYKEGPNKAAQVCWKTKLLQFEYDADDGEVRAIIEFPLEDSKLTQKQLMRCLNGLVQIVDEYHSVLVRAMQSGEIDFARGERKAETEKLAAEIRSYAGIEGLGKAGPLSLEE
jgi:hypothetical protein